MSFHFQGIPVIPVQQQPFVFGTVQNVSLSGKPIPQGAQPLYSTTTIKGGYTPSPMYSQSAYVMVPQQFGPQVVYPMHGGIVYGRRYPF